VLLLGETGTGKSHIARHLHLASDRSSGAFVHVNCGAIPEALAEAELFGAEAGAFTGATGRRIGKFEAASGGTLFLDELQSMPPECQVKLLVALEEGVITRLGSNAPIRVDTRIVAALNEDPFECIEREKLREDLYYRLAVIVANIPPLRERPEDIPLLGKHILVRAQDRYGLGNLRLTEEALQKLMCHSWPGNVRELENALDRAALLGEESMIHAEHLPAASGAVVRKPPPSRTRKAVTQDEFHAAWEEAGGDIARVADALGTHPKSVFRLRRRFGTGVTRE
jgi:transcriptional regulator with PAS, ATPase and Fis domain